MGSIFHGRCRHCEYSVDFRVGDRFAVYTCEVCELFVNVERYRFRIDYPSHCGRLFRQADRVDLFTELQCPLCKEATFAFQVGASVRWRHDSQLPQIGQLIHVLGDERGRPIAVGLRQNVKLAERAKFSFDETTVLECEVLEVCDRQIRVEVMRERARGEFSGYFV